MKERVITFDKAIPELIRLIEDSSSELKDLEKIFVIRDLLGRMRLFVESRPAAGTAVERALLDLARAARERLGPWALPEHEAILHGDDLTFDWSDDLDAAMLLREERPQVRLLDRQVTGMAWGRAEDPGVPGTTPRLVFYSLKGGVGRSTALAVTAWHLAAQGRRVLVLDLDLEAPGLSTSLLPPPNQPEFGLVDWFVEDAVGQGDHCLDKMISSSPLGRELPGEILVVPAHGNEPGDYLAKLGRCYLDLPLPTAVQPDRWERRLLRVVHALEQRTDSDITLLDVRAGLPDLAAVPTTSSAAEILLFAIDTEQTWAGYRILFDFWNRVGVIRALRERLHMVAAMVPETQREAYLSGFRERAWDLFLTFAYDHSTPNEELLDDVFTFDLADETAPHTPIPVNWHRGFASLRDLNRVDTTLVTAAFGNFLQFIDGLLPAAIGNRL